MSTSSTRRSTVNLNIPTKNNLNIQYADGTRVQGFFTENIKWKFAAFNQQSSTSFYSMIWGVATIISEVVPPRPRPPEKQNGLEQEEQQVLSRFESGGVDGWLGFGRPKKDEQEEKTNSYPPGHALIASDFSTGSWSVSFRLHTRKHELVFRRYDPSTTTTDEVLASLLLESESERVREDDPHWSIVVRNVVVNGCRAVDKEYNVLLDVGAGSIFAARDMIEPECWKVQKELASQWSDEESFSLEFTMGRLGRGGEEGEGGEGGEGSGGRRIIVEKLVEGVSYHRTLVPRRKGREWKKRATIVLGLPFFMRKLVTLTTVREKNKKKSYWVGVR